MGGAIWFIIRNKKRAVIFEQLAINAKLIYERALVSKASTAVRLLHCFG